MILCLTLVLRTSTFYLWTNLIMWAILGFSGCFASQFTLQIVQIINGGNKNLGVAFADSGIAHSQVFSAVVHRYIWQSHRGKKTKSFHLYVFLRRKRFIFLTLQLICWVEQWSDGKISHVIRKVNSSWTHRKWGSSAVQFDANTWILEYQRSSILENPRLVSATLAFLRYRVSRIVGQIKQDLWLFSAFESVHNYHSFALKDSVQVPT